MNTPTPSDKFKLSPEQSLADEGWDNNDKGDLIGFEENDGWGKLQKQFLNRRITCGFNDVFLRTV